jgi:thiol:disulfide interchange protein DsbD
MIGRAGLLVLVAAGLVAGREPPPPSIEWRLAEAAAIAESQRTARPLLVDAWADWCGACKLLERNTWSDPRVRREVASHFVPLRLDFSDDGPSTERLQRAYGMTALPAVLICSPEGCDAVAARSVGYVGPAEMLDFLTRGRRGR